MKSGHRRPGILPLLWLSPQEEGSLEGTGPAEQLKAAVQRIREHPATSSTPLIWCGSALSLQTAEAAGSHLAERIANVGDQILTEGYSGAHPALLLRSELEQEVRWVRSSPFANPPFANTHRTDSDEPKSGAVPAGMARRLSWDPEARFTREALETFGVALTLPEWYPHGFADGATLHTQWGSYRFPQAGIDRVLPGVDYRVTGGERVRSMFSPSLRRARPTDEGAAPEAAALRTALRKQLTRAAHRARRSGSEHPLLVLLVPLATQIGLERLSALLDLCVEPNAAISLATPDELLQAQAETLESRSVRERRPHGVSGGASAESSEAAPEPDVPLHRPLQPRHRRRLFTVAHRRSRSAEDHDPQAGTRSVLALLGTGRSALPNSDSVHARDPATADRNGEPAERLYHANMTGQTVLDGDGLEARFDNGHFCGLVPEDSAPGRASSRAPSHAKAGTVSGEASFGVCDGGWLRDDRGAASFETLSAFTFEQGSLRGLTVRMLMERDGFAEPGVLDLDYAVPDQGPWLFLDAFLRYPQLQAEHARDGLSSFLPYRVPLATLDPPTNPEEISIHLLYPDGSEYRQTLGHPVQEAHLMGPTETPVTWCAGSVATLTVGSRALRAFRVLAGSAKLVPEFALQLVRHSGAQRGDAMTVYLCPFGAFRDIPFSSWEGCSERIQLGFTPRAEHALEMEESLGIGAYS